MKSAYTNNIEYARSLQEKYEYYIAGLTFTLLALSIQSASFSGDRPQIILELLGWLGLSISGFIALNRFRWQPVAHKNFAKLDKAKDTATSYKAAKEQGTRELIYSDTGKKVDIDQAIKETDTIIELSEPKLKKLELKLTKLSVWHLRLFIAGIAFIMLSRAFSPLKLLLN